MTQALDLRFAELLAARLCHELAGPVAAIGNGIEVIAEEAPQLAHDAVSLVADSARRAAGRLQFTGSPAASSRIRRLPERRRTRSRTRFLRARGSDSIIRRARGRSRFCGGSSPAT
jgi:hypothetical protein